MCLPTFVVDIIQHDLQCHRGNHPNNLYYDRVAIKIKKLQKDSKILCNNNSGGQPTKQKDLITMLDNLSKSIESKIKKRKYLLRSDALNEVFYSEKKLAKKVLKKKIESKIDRIGL